MIPHNIICFILRINDESTIHAGHKDPHLFRQVHLHLTAKTQRDPPSRSFPIIQPGLTAKRIIKCVHQRLNQVDPERWNVYWLLTKGVPISFNTHWRDEGGFADIDTSVQIHEALEREFGIEVKDRNVLITDVETAFYVVTQHHDSLWDIHNAYQLYHGSALAVLLWGLFAGDSDLAHVVSCLENGGKGLFWVCWGHLGNGDLGFFDLFVHLSPLLCVEVQKEELDYERGTSYFFIDSLMPPE